MAENKRQLWVPEGFAHGFVVTSEVAEFLYKTTDYWYPEHERCIIWDDSELAIDWPTCLVSHDHISQRIQKLATAREVLGTLLADLKAQTS